MNILPVSLQKKTHKRTKFYVLLSLLLSCCFVEYVFGMYIPQAILLGIAFAAAMTGDADENAALCMCCVPLHTFFEYAFVIRETVALDCTAEIIAEYPSEVFVSCVRQEAS